MVRAVDSLQHQFNIIHHVTPLYTQTHLLTLLSRQIQARGTAEVLIVPLRLLYYGRIPIGLRHDTV
jgi:hypothetical protein